MVGRVFDGKLQDALRNVVWSFLRIPEELVIAMGGGRPEEHLLAYSLQKAEGKGRRWGQRGGGFPPSRASTLGAWGVHRTACEVGCVRCEL